MKVNLLTLAVFSCLFLISAYTADRELNPSQKHQQQVADDPGVKTIDCYNNSISFSGYSTPGKVSVFILSIHGCKPCVELKDALDRALKTGDIPSKYVDVYYCPLTKDNKESLSDLDKKRGAYSNFKNVDVLTDVFPTVYINGPTTNCFATVKGNKYDEIIKYITDLSFLSKNYFNINKHSFHGKALPTMRQQNRDSSKHDGDADSILAIKKQMDSLKKQNLKLRTMADSLLNENRFLYSQLSSLNYERERWYLQWYR